jgi:hypothetical protein
MRNGRLLVGVRALSGTLYPPGTEVRVSGGGEAVDAWVRGDWLPLSWWEFTEVDPEPERQSAEA